MPHIAAKLPPDDETRVTELRRLKVLDSAPEAVYDDLALLASQICGTPAALVSFVDKNRQWFKARVGVVETETFREVAFCSHAILQRSLLVVNDTHLDPRFSHNPLVSGGPRIRSYAGAPIIHSSGHAFGTVCVLDTVPRQLDSVQLQALEALARQAASHLEIRTRALDAELTARMLRSEIVLRREVLLCANDAMVVLDAEMAVVDASQSFADMLGYALREAMTLNPWDWDVTFNSKPRILERRARSPNQKQSFRSTWRRKDGSTLEVEIGHSLVQTTSGPVALLVARP